jgi:glucose 1-dehydrogenase
VLPEDPNYPTPLVPSGCVPPILKGQRAIVTGANTGIGKAVAIALGQAGADVVVNYLQGEDEAGQVVEMIRRTGSLALAVQADIAREDEVQALFGQAVDEFGTLDILVNNAGLHDEAPIDKMTLAQWNHVIGVNLTGQFLCIREAIRLFKQRGVIEPVSVSAGKIICISSVHEVIPYGGNANYAASKAGVMQLMKSVAQEVAPYRIRVNSICPGLIRTGINSAVWEDPETYEMAMRAIPYKRIGEPDEIGRMAVFLASDQADYMNGASLFVDGGMMLYSGLRELVRENLHLRRQLAAQPQSL